jgi:hypothetical protein
VALYKIPLDNPAKQGLSYLSCLNIEQIVFEKYFLQPSGKIACIKKITCKSNHINNVNINVHIPDGS